MTKQRELSERAPGGGRSNEHSGSGGRTHIFFTNLWNRKGMEKGASEKSEIW